MLVIAVFSPSHGEKSTPARHDPPSEQRGSENDQGVARYARGSKIRCLLIPDVCRSSECTRVNTSQLSKYAPAARTAFIASVSARAARLGITSGDIVNAKVQGDVLLVGGEAFPRAIAAARKSLVERVEAHGFEATMEAIAYTWFNRFVAIRYMELHGYFDHGYRILSHPEGLARPG